MHKYFLVAFLTFSSVFPSLTREKLNEYHQWAVENLRTVNEFKHAQRPKRASQIQVVGSFDTLSRKTIYAVSFLNQDNQPETGLVEHVEGLYGEQGIIRGRTCTNKQREQVNTDILQIFQAFSERIWVPSSSLFRNSTYAIQTTGYVENSLQTLKTTVPAKLNTTAVVTSSAMALATAAVAAVTLYKS